MPFTPLIGPPYSGGWPEYSSGGGTFTAVGAATLPSLSASGTATCTPPVVTATGAATLPSLSVAATATFTVGGIIIRGTRITLVKDNDYFASDNRQLEFPMQSFEVWPDLTDAIVTLNVTITGTDTTHSVEGTVITATGSDRKVAIEFDESVTGAAGYGRFTLIATLTSGNTATLRRGEVWIRP